jgi:hypothetical protein
MCHIAITLKTCLVSSGRLTVVVAALARSAPCVCFEALTQLRVLPRDGCAGCTELLPLQQRDAVLAGFPRQRGSGEFHDGQLGTVEDAAAFLQVPAESALSAREG